MTENILSKSHGDDFEHERRCSAGGVSEEAVDAFIGVYFGAMPTYPGDREEVKEALAAAFKAKGHRYLPLKTTN